MLHVLASTEYLFVPGGNSITIIITQIITAFTTSFRLYLVVDIDCAQCIHIICFMVHIHNWKINLLSFD